MIRPEKYMSLEQCTLSVAAIILTEIREQLVLTPAQLEELIVASLGHSALTNLQSALNVTYLLGCLDYDQPEDAFFYVAKKERGLK